MGVNFFIILLVLLMALAWGIQGFFSAFLHLVLVILAGAVAMAVWEPLVLNYLLGYSPDYAWSLGLLLPFILVLLTGRIILHIILLENEPRFQSPTFHFAAAICGVIAGVFTSGILIIGLGFLPINQKLMGYQPLAVNANGTISGRAGDGLIIPADRITADFYTLLSDGAFNAGYPMSLYRPGLAEAPLLSRLSRAFDPDSSLVATPGSVTVDDMLIRNLPAADIDQELIRNMGPTWRDSNSRIVVVSTLWTRESTDPAKAGPAFDPDGTPTLRVPANQIRLVAWTGSEYSRTGLLLAPVAVSLINGSGEQVLVPLDDDKYFPISTSSPVRLKWVFLVPANASPRFLLARDLRLAVPEPDEKSTVTLGQALGRLSRIWFARMSIPLPEVGPRVASPTPPRGSSTSTVNPGSSARGSTSPTFFPPATAPAGTGPHSGQPIMAGQPSLDMTAELPLAIDADKATTIDFDANRLIRRANATVRPAAEPYPPNLATALSIEQSYVCLRVTLSGELLKEVFGDSRDGERMQQEIWLDAVSSLASTKIKPASYVLHTPATGTMRIITGEPDSIANARALPIAGIGSKDVLYLYFVIQKGRRIVQLNLGYDAHFPAAFTIR